MTLVLPAECRTRMCAHGARELPREGCGLLLGEEGRVAEVVPTRNDAESPTRYRIDPRDHFDVVRRARAEGLSVIGAFHSHPSSAPVPSATDLAEAWPGFLYLIVSLAPQWQTQPIRAWRVEAGNFVEVFLVTPAEEARTPPCMLDTRSPC